jgi:hypothetical protein
MPTAYRTAPNSLFGDERVSGEFPATNGSVVPELSVAFLAIFSLRG